MTRGNYIYRLLAFIAVTAGFFGSVMLAGCDVHEFPAEGEELPVYSINLEFDTGIREQDYTYTKVSDHTGQYDMRYTLRVFPVSWQNSSATVSREHVWEHVFTSPVEKGMYNVETQVEMDLPDGEYVIHVWADFVPAGTASHHFYNPDNFSEIIIHSSHKANTDMRDAYRGTASFRASRDTVENARILHVEMDRPLAKFEFRATDLAEFVEKVYNTKLGDDLNVSQADSLVSNVLQEYTVKFSYTGFMPCAFDMFTNKPNDARTGVTFETKLSKLDNGEVSMGFDYVFVNGIQSTVSMIMAMYDTAGKSLFETNPIEVPVQRGMHSIMRGSFLTIDTQGGVGIVPDFDGSYNYEIKY